MFFSMKTVFAELVYLEKPQKGCFLLITAIIKLFGLFIEKKAWQLYDRILQLH